MKISYLCALSKRTLYQSTYPIEAFADGKYITVNGFLKIPQKYVDSGQSYYGSYYFSSQDLLDKFCDEHSGKGFFL